MNAMGRHLYRDVIPYEAPTTLDDLRGPRAGVIRLPISVFWGPDRTFDLENVDLAVMAYQALIRDGTVAAQDRFLNRRRLVELWPDLTLPVRCRELWESRFPELQVLLR